MQTFLAADGKAIPPRNGREHIFFGFRVIKNSINGCTTLISTTANSWWLLLFPRVSTFRIFLVAVIVNNKKITELQQNQPLQQTKNFQQWRYSWSISMGLSTATFQCQEKFQATLKNFWQYQHRYLFRSSPFVKGFHKRHSTTKKNSNSFFWEASAKASQLHFYGLRKIKFLFF